MSEADQVVLTTCRRCGRETVVGKYGHVCAACVEVQRAKSPQLNHVNSRNGTGQERDIDSNGWYSNARRQLEDRE